MKKRLLYCSAILYVSLYSMNEKMVDLRDELLQKYDELSTTKNKEELTQKIKSFHQEYGISYQGDRWCRFSPLREALKSCDTGFTIFLLKDRDVPLKSETITGYEENLDALHFVIQGIEDDNITPAQHEIFNLLVKKGADINSFDKNDHTPLYQYITQRRTEKFLLNEQLLESFFDKKATIFSKLQNSSKACNALFSTAEKSMNWDSDDAVITAAKLFKARLAQTKKRYFYIRCCFCYLNKSRLKQSLWIIPKPIMQMIINMVLYQEDEFVDIQKSLEQKQLVATWVYDNRQFDYTEVMRYKEEKRLMNYFEFIQNNDEVNDNKELCFIASQTFWSRSLKTCLEDLSRFIKQAEFNKERSKKLLSEHIEKIFEKVKKKKLNDDNK